MQQRKMTVRGVESETNYDSAGTNETEISLETATFKCWFCHEAAHK